MDLSWNMAWILGGKGFVANACWVWYSWLWGCPWPTGRNFGRPTRRSIHRSSCFNNQMLITRAQLRFSFMGMRVAPSNVGVCWWPLFKAHLDEDTIKNVSGDKLGVAIQSFKSILLGTPSLQGMLWAQYPRHPMMCSLKFFTLRWRMLPSHVRRCLTRATWTSPEVEKLSRLSFWGWRVMPLTWQKLLISTGHTTQRPREEKSVVLLRVSALTVLLVPACVLLRRLIRTTLSGSKQWGSSFLGFEHPSLIRHLLNDPGDPVSFFRSDIWHVVHLGFGRSWIASVIQVVLPHLPCSNLEEKWVYLTSDYLEWCAANRKQAHVSRITPYLMSYGDTSGAMGNWHKGALTSNFMAWIVELLQKIPCDAEGLLIECRCATDRLNAMFSVLYHASAFLTEQECKYVSECGLGYLESYAKLAVAMYHAGRQWCFPLYPKVHVFHHLILEVKRSGAVCKTAVNPTLWGCQNGWGCCGESVETEPTLQHQIGCIQNIGALPCLSFCSIHQGRDAGLKKRIWVALFYQVFGIVCCGQVLSPDLSHISCSLPISHSKILPYVKSWWTFTWWCCLFIIQLHFQEMENIGFFKITYVFFYTLKKEGLGGWRYILYIYIHCILVMIT